MPVFLELHQQCGDMASNILSHLASEGFAIDAV